MSPTTLQAAIDAWVKAEGEMMNLLKANLEVQCWGDEYKACDRALVAAEKQLRDLATVSDHL